MKISQVSQASETQHIQDVHVTIVDWIESFMPLNIGYISVATTYVKVRTCYRKSTEWRSLCFQSYLSVSHSVHSGEGQSLHMTLVHFPLVEGLGRSPFCKGAMPWPLKTRGGKPSQTHTWMQIMKKLVYSLLTNKCNFCCNIVNIFVCMQTCRKCADVRSVCTIWITIKLSLNFQQT